MHLLSKSGGWRRTFASRATLLLPPPTVLYSNNHLLVVNKPAGWHSIPLDNKDSRKCLLSWLKRQYLGGGSRRDFLLPLHRLDQPCTGVLLFAKTSKAASRITQVWKKHQVMKEYTCVLSSKTLLHSLKRASRLAEDDDDWYEIRGIMKRSRKPGSVNMMPFLVESGEYSDEFHSDRGEKTASSRNKTRVCTMKWRMHETPGINYPLIVVQTSEGARHMVRSVLGQVGHAPIAGDVRYGATRALPDRSVALHASRVSLPQSLVLPLDQHEFVTPLPNEWKAWFV